MLSSFRLCRELASMSHPDQDTSMPTAQTAHNGNGSRAATQTTDAANIPVHPDSERRDNALGILIRVAIPILILAAGIFAFSRLSIEQPEEKAKAAEKQKIRTRVATLTVTDYPLIVKTNGIVQSHNEVAISAEVGGQITSISSAFEVGAYFKAGDVLLELDSRDYETSLAMAEAQKLGSEAAVDLAKETYERNGKLYDKKGISEAVLKQSLAAMLQAEAQLEASKSQLERASRDLSRAKVVAPFDGRVRIRNVGVGQSVGPGAPLGVVFAVDFAEVRLPIASKELQYLTLPELASDSPVAVDLTDAINPDNKTVWKGEIVRTEGTLDLNSLELFAIARVDDPFGRKSGQPPLRIGQPVIASIAGKTLNDVVPIPREAVRQLDQIYLVHKEGDDLVLESRKVTAIWSDEDQLIVDDPTITDGQMIATTRIVYAPDGAKCEIIPEVVEELTSQEKDAEAIENKVADGTKPEKKKTVSN